MKILSKAIIISLILSVLFSHLAPARPYAWYDGGLGWAGPGYSWGATYDPYYYNPYYDGLYYHRHHRCSRGWIYHPSYGCYDPNYYYVDPITGAIAAIAGLAAAAATSDSYEAPRRIRAGSRADRYYDDYDGDNSYEDYGEYDTYADYDDYDDYRNNESFDNNGSFDDEEYIFARHALQQKKAELEKKKQQLMKQQHMLPINQFGK